MSDFVKPTRAIVSADDYIKDILKDGLIKDLHGNEEICEYCHGTGIVKTDNIYGLSDDPDRSIINLFPFKHQSFTFCPHCFNGVVQRCELCGEIIKKGWVKHDCPQQKEKDRQEADEKELLAWAAAKEYPAEKLDELGYGYLDGFGREGYFGDWDTFFDEWADIIINESVERPTHIWGTQKQEMSIDVDILIENATEDLYEDAASDISDNEYKKLKDFLDNWCATCGVSASYSPDYKVKIKIPWEEYDKEGER